MARKDLDAQVEQKAKDLLRSCVVQTARQPSMRLRRLQEETLKIQRRRQNGGFLTEPFKKNENKPHSLYDRAVDMKPGDVSDIPIRYGGNWYILRRGDDVPEDLRRSEAGVVGFVAQSSRVRCCVSRLHRKRTRTSKGN